jgi:hypothetical protein
MKLARLHLVYPPTEEGFVMQNVLSNISLCCITALASGPSASAAEQPLAAVPSVWQHHAVSVNYFGITSLYTCDGLESHVKSILLHFGARQDASVTANGCSPGPNSPSRIAVMYTNFYTLAPSSDPTTADVVSAQWTSLEMRPNRPFFMGGGDCELVEQLKDLLSNNFSLRDVSYRTNCVPHAIGLDGFSVKVQALKAIPVAKSASARY